MYFSWKQDFFLIWGGLSDGLQRAYFQACRRLLSPQPPPRAASVKVLQGQTLCLSSGWGQQQILGGWEPGGPRSLLIFSLHPSP